MKEKFFLWLLDLLVMMTGWERIEVTTSEGRFWAVKYQEYFPYRRQEGTKS